MQSVQFEETSQIGEARRQAGALCRQLGFDENRAGIVSLVVTEMSTNLVKHAIKGMLILRAIEPPEDPAIEILSLDKGPGIKNMAQSLRDGHSTAGSMGTGLGAIRRLSSFFDIYTTPNHGTAVFSRIEKVAPSPNPRRVQSLAAGAVCLPVNGEEIGGDAWAMAQTGSRTLVMVADGLGHGIYAAEAATAAVQCFENNHTRSPAEIIQLIHTALKATRGAAVAIAEILPGQQLVNYAGVGNIGGTIISRGANRRMVSHNGTAGLEVRKIQEFSYPWPDGGLMILHSDGLSTHWSLEDYPGLQPKHPAVIAGVLFRDHNRAKDDSAVVVIKNEGRTL